MRTSSSRIVVAALTITAVSMGVTGCGAVSISSASESGAAGGSGLHMAADSDLLAPPSSETYVVKSEAQQTEVTSGDRTLLSAASTAAGVIVISDGIMSDAEISASIGDNIEFTFVLTEPVLFERQGRVAETIVAIGSLSSESISFPQVKMVLEPTVTGTTATVDATIEIPDSVTGRPFSPTGAATVSLTLDLIEQ